MDAKCCRLLFGDLRRVVSPFVRLIATDYYDGPTEGIIECGACSRVYSFRKLDWDQGQDVRIFALSPIPGCAISEFEARAAGEVVSKWPSWVLMEETETEIAATVDGIRDMASPAEFIVATEDLLSLIEAWRPVGLSDDVDWFSELGLNRAIST